MFQNNPAYIQLGPTESLQAAASVSESCSQNPAYLIHHVADPEHNDPVASTNESEEPTYDIIQDTGTPSNYSQNPAYIHLSVGINIKEAGFETDPTSTCDCSQNPAYGIHSNPK